MDLLIILWKKVGKTPDQSSSANEPTEAGTPLVIQSSNDELRNTSTNDMLPQLCTLLANQMQQQLQLQREQDERHQRQLQYQREQDKWHQEMMQLLLTLNVGDNASPNRHSTAPFPQ